MVSTSPDTPLPLAIAAPEGSPPLALDGRADGDVAEAGPGSVGRYWHGERRAAEPGRGHRVPQRAAGCPGGPGAAVRRGMVIGVGLPGGRRRAGNPLRTGGGLVRGRPD